MYTIVEAILFIVLIICAGSMDSPNMVLPCIGVFVSAIGLLIMSRLEGYR